VIFGQKTCIFAKYCMFFHFLAKMAFFTCFGPVFDQEKMGVFQNFGQIFDQKMQFI